MSLAEFHRTFTVSKAVALLSQIEGTLRKEARKVAEGHYYSGLRHAFAEIDGLGKLYCGERGTSNTAKNAICFGRDYLTLANSSYRDLFGLLMDMYRHGLAHTHLAKSIRFRGPANRWITVGWAISDEGSLRFSHLTLFQRDMHFFVLMLHVPQFVRDTLLAIQRYRRDLRQQGETSRLFSRFKRGYIGTAAVFSERASPPGGATPASLRGSGKPKQKGKRSEPLLLNAYSIQGLAWIRQEINRGNIPPISSIMKAR
jgi:hypothetical protein